MIRCTSLIIYVREAEQFFVTGSLAFVVLINLHYSAPICETKFPVN
jgi:hypothetical protein